MPRACVRGAVALEDDVRAYFAGERRAGAVFAAVGLVALYLVATDHALHAASLPLAMAGVLELGVGATAFGRAPHQAQGVLAGLSTVWFDAVSRESVRMTKVLVNLRMYRWAELAFLITGTILLGFSAELFAFGAGLVAQAGALLLLDAAAEHRARRYARALDEAVARRDAAA
jgi:hypothetical protein